MLDKDPGHVGASLADIGWSGHPWNGWGRNESPLPGLPFDLHMIGVARQLGAQVALMCPPLAAATLQLSIPRQIRRTPPMTDPPSEFTQDVQPVLALCLHAGILRGAVTAKADGLRY